MGKVEVTDEMVERARERWKSSSWLTPGPKDLKAILEAAINPPAQKRGTTVELKTGGIKWGAPGGAEEPEAVQHNIAWHGGNVSAERRQSDDATPAEKSTVAVGVVPNRNDHLLSLHVGGGYVLLSRDEAWDLGLELKAKSWGATKPQRTGGQS